MINTNWYQDLVEEDWDVLIILDTCRYDYFQKVYKEYIDGRLRRGVSPTPQTIEWLSSVFTRKRDDIIYLSSIPFINSQMDMEFGEFKFAGKDMFHKVIDVWDFGWDNTHNTVMPEEINKTYLTARLSYPNKKFILHYLQPHSPYISMGGKGKEFDGSMFTKEAWLKPISSVVPTSRIREFLTTTLERELGQLRVWKLRQMLGMKTYSEDDYIIRKYGIERLRELYEDNLRIVLKSISELVPKIDGRVIIISDHGHMLGEHGYVGHSDNMKRRYKELVEVPYLEVVK